jgi:hypothetical protein
VKGLIDAHVAGGGGSMVGRENITSKRCGNNNQHEELFIVLNWLEDDQLEVNKRNAILANIVAIC